MRDPSTGGVGRLDPSIGGLGKGIKPGG